MRGSISISPRHLTLWTTVSSSVNSRVITPTHNLSPASEASRLVLHVRSRSNAAFQHQSPQPPSYLGSGIVPFRGLQEVNFCFITKSTQGTQKSEWWELPFIFSDANLLVQSRYAQMQPWPCTRIEYWKITTNNYTKYIKHIPLINNIDMEGRHWK